MKWYEYETVSKDKTFPKLEGNNIWYCSWAIPYRNIIFKVKYALKYKNSIFIYKNENSTSIAILPRSSINSEKPIPVAGEKSPKTSLLALESSGLSALRGFQVLADP